MPCDESLNALPCPCCGADSVGLGSRYVSCDCGLILTKDSLEEAVDAWNRRAHPTPDGSLIEKLEANAFEYCNKKLLTLDKAIAIARQHGASSPDSDAVERAEKAMQAVVDDPTMVVSRDFMRHWEALRTRLAKAAAGVCSEIRDTGSAGIGSGAVESAAERHYAGASAPADRLPARLGDALNIESAPATSAVLPYTQADDTCGAKLVWSSNATPPLPELYPPSSAPADSKPVEFDTFDLTATVEAHLGGLPESERPAVAWDIVHALRSRVAGLRVDHQPVDLTAAANAIDRIVDERGPSLNWTAEELAEACAKTWGLTWKS